ncbi:multidrug ABC transporter permease [Virgibacillus indicus]|uniref:Multidrug ABC transporter permease n=1 Tax=Virgibacillus indicus TaxID=2024554 RepID=A0A265N772_9BACI|nr:ABC transporter permease [Virgibacillus indicus]OZU87842.1 multidrug ABC transporter permease [Virgibacillus indicus]
MIGILLAKFRMFIRNPFVFVLFTGMSIGFALMVGGTGGASTIHVPVYAEDDSVKDSFIGEKLKTNEAYSFNWISEEEMKEQISNGKAEAGAILSENDFQIIVGVDSANASMIEETIRGAYVEKLRQEQILEASNAESESEKEKVLEELEAAKNSPAFTIKTSSLGGSDTVVYDNTFHSLFGFTLFFVIYTIAYNLLPVLIEKKDGIWDRMILSPVKKWEMYVANLIYSFFEGYLQVLIIFLVFRYWVGVDFNGRFAETLLLLMPYVFAIVALSIFLTAVTKTVQQFNAVIPIVAVSMAMIGGAYWPIEIVESKILLALSKINPVTYGMEVLNGTAVYGYPLEELLYPISILLLMGVVLTGIGIHLMERRHV